MSNDRHQAYIMTDDRILVNEQNIITIMKRKIFFFTVVDVKLTDIKDSSQIAKLFSHKETAKCKKTTKQDVKSNKAYPNIFPKCRFNRIIIMLQHVARALSVQLYGKYHSAKK